MNEKKSLKEKITMKGKYKKVICEIRDDISLLESLNCGYPIDKGFSNLEAVVLENLLKNLKKIFKKGNNK